MHFLDLLDILLFPFLAECEKGIKIAKSLFFPFVLAGPNGKINFSMHNRASLCTVQPTDRPSQSVHKSEAIKFPEKKVHKISSG